MSTGEWTLVWSLRGAIKVDWQGIEREEDFGRTGTGYMYYRAGEFRHGPRDVPINYLI